jgi:hypothetical protein
MFFLFGRAASVGFAALASGYPLHHTLPHKVGLAVWFRYYPSRNALRAGIGGDSVAY